MLKDAPTFSGFSVNDLQAAKDFYGNTLGIEFTEDMGVHLKLHGGAEAFIYEKGDHRPATFTILNFIVEDISAAVDGLVEKGAVFERYDNMPAPQDERGILRGLAAGQGPDIAWFKDPAGNILALLQNK